MTPTTRVAAGGYTTGSILAKIGALNVAKQKTRRIGVRVAAVSDGGNAIVNLGSFVDGEFIDRITVYATPSVALNVAEQVGIRYGFFTKDPATTTEFENCPLPLTDFGNFPEMPLSLGFYIFPVNVVASPRFPKFSIQLFVATGTSNADIEFSVWIDTTFPPDR